MYVAKWFYKHTSHGKWKPCWFIARSYEIIIVEHQNMAVLECILRVI